MRETSSTLVECFDSHLYTCNNAIECLDNGKKLMQLKKFNDAYLSFQTCLINVRIFTLNQSKEALVSEKVDYCKLEVIEVKAIANSAQVMTRRLPLLYLSSNKKTHFSLSSNMSSVFMSPPKYLPLYTQSRLSISLVSVTALYPTHISPLLI